MNFKQRKIFYLLSLFILFFLPDDLLAQESQVRGSVMDAETDEPLSFANIALLNPADSTLMYGGMSDESGRFEFAAEQGRYLLRVGFIGYTQFFEKVEVDDSGLRTGTIRLPPDATTLEEVTVEGVSSMFESEIDKRVYNVENSIIAEGGTATELLSSLPSIQIDEEGGISMRGSGNVLIYINGRPTNLSSEETESILAQFPANSIKDIELITNPSSRYDASGVGGIINIVLKKNERLGFNGQVNASVGTRNKYTGGLNMNYNTGKFNFYTSYNYQSRDLFELSESLRQAKTQGDVSPFLDQDFDTQNTRQSHLVRGGVDYNFNKNSVIGIYGQYNYRSRDRIRIYNQRHQKLNRELDSLFNRTLTEDQFSTNLETGITYSLELDSAGQSLYASLSYATDQQTRTEYFDQLYFNSEMREVPENRIMQIYGRPQDDELYILQLDYNKPFAGNGALELGWKSTLSLYDRAQTFEQFDLNTNQYVVNDSIEDRFTFNEYVHAAYAIYKNSLGNLSYQAGLRGELTLTDSYWFDENSEYINNYFNLFPSLYLAYSFAQENEMQLNYSRRISRPGTGALAPFYNAQDLLNTRFGNPYLQPELTDSYELGYVKGWQNLLFTGTVYHRRAYNTITRIIFLQPDNVAVQTWENANRRVSTGLELINQWQLSDHVDATLSGNFFHSEIIGENIREGFNNTNFSWTISLLSNILIPQIATIQLQGDYRGPIVLPQGEIEPIYGLNIGIRKDVLEKKLSLSLNVSDIFNTRIFRIQTDGPDFYQERLFNRETRIATFSVTYRFGGFKDKKSSSGSRDEYGDDPF